MSRKNYIYALLFLPVLFYGCKKQKLQPSTEGDPVFSFEGAIGKDSLKIFAGKDDYYLYSSSAADSLGIFYFTGEFRKTTCSGICPGTLSIHLRDYKIRTGKDVNDIGNVLHPGPYKFYNHTDSTPVFRFTADTLFPGKGGYHWDLGDGSTSDLWKVSYIFPPTSSAGYKVCLKTTSPSGCPSDICNLLNTNFPGGCHAFFKADPIAGTTSIQFSTPQTGPNTYKWDFGDSSAFSNMAGPKHSYQKPGVYKVCLTVSPNNGPCKATFCKTVVAGIPPQQCGSSYSYSIVRLPANLSCVQVKWTDAGGKQYSSARPGGKPSPQSYFEILSADEYKQNSSGEKTRMISARVNAVLYNESNPMDSLIINGNKFVFAVAYP